MRSIPRPATSATAAFAISISRVRDKGLKSRLLSVRGEIAKAARRYEGLAGTGRLHLYPIETRVGAVTAKELTTNYEQRFAAKRSPGRVIYDALMIAAPESRCPLCAQRTVTSLDHHLPKTAHPALAVTPLNLVPSCSDCNKVKLDRLLTARSDQTLHPYFDHVEGEAWLTASVIDASPQAVIYAATPPSTWPQDLQSRATKHFEVFGLADLYAAQAATEMAEVALAHHELLNAGGPDLLRSHLDLMYRSCHAVQPSSWRAALYHALARSKSYIEGTGVDR